MGSAFDRKGILTIEDAGGKGANCMFLHVEMNAFVSFATKMSIYSVTLKQTC